MRIVNVIMPLFPLNPFVIPSNGTYSACIFANLFTSVFTGFMHIKQLALILEFMSPYTIIIYYGNVTENAHKKSP